MRRRRSLSIRLGISINVWQASSLACFWLSDSGWYISRLRCFNVGFDALIALHKVFGCTLAVETILASCLLSRRAWLKDEKGMLTSDPRCLKPAAKISVATLICFSSNLEGAPVRWQSVVYLPSLNARFQRLRKAYDFAGMARPILCTRSCLAFLRLLSHLIMHSIAARRHLTGLAGPAEHNSVSNNQIYDALVSASKKHHWHDAQCKCIISSLMQARYHTPQPATEQSRTKRILASVIWQHQYTGECEILRMSTANRSILIPRSS